MTDEPIPEDLTSIADEVRAWSDHAARAMDLPGGDLPLVDGPASPGTAPSAPAATTAPDAAPAPARRRRRAVLIAAAAIAVVAIGAAAFAGLGGDDPDDELRVATDPGVTASSTSVSVSTTASLDATTTSAPEGSTATTSTEPQDDDVPVVVQPQPTGPVVTPQPSTPGSVDPGGPTTTTSTTPPLTGGPITGQLILPTTTVASGRTITGTLRVTNGNGRPLAYIYCGSAFGAGLSNDEAVQEVAFAMCATHGTLAPGTTDFRITIRADFGSCSTMPTPPPPSVSCVDGGIPGLPAGSYRLKIFGPDDLPLTVTTPEITVTE